MKYKRNKRNTGLNRILGKENVKQLGPIYKTTEADLIVVNKKLVKLYSDTVIVISEEGTQYNLSLITPNSRELLQSLLSDTRENFTGLLVGGNEVFKNLYQLFLKETVQTLLKSDIFIYKDSNEFETSLGFRIRFTLYNDTITIIDSTNVSYTNIIRNFVVTSLNKESIAKEINNLITDEISKRKNN